MFKKNTTITGFGIGHFINATTGTAVTTGTPVCKRTIDGTGGACANAASYNTDGAVWEIDLAASDLNGSVIILSFTLTDCLPISYTIKTAQVDVDDAVRMGLSSLPNAIPGQNGGLCTTNGTKQNQTVDLTAGQVLDAAGIRGAVGMANADLDSQLAALDTAIDYHNMGLDDAAADVSAVKTKTDQLTFTTPNKVDATADATLSDGNITSIASAVLDSLLDSTEFSRISSGVGSIAHSYTLLDNSGNSIPDARIFVYSDSSCNTKIAQGTTNNFGQHTFYLDAGTYYFVRVKAGYKFDNPDTEVVA